MTTIKIGDKTLVIEDGCNVEVAGDEIRVRPGAPQPVYVPMPTIIPQPWAPVYPRPVWGAPLNPFLPGFPTITCDGSQTFSGIPDVTASNHYQMDANGESPYVISGERLQ